MNRRTPRRTATTVAGLVTLTLVSSCGPKDSSDADTHSPTPPPPPTSALDAIEPIAPTEVDEDAKTRARESLAKGRTAFESRDFAGARDAFEAATTADPNLVDAWVAMGRTYVVRSLQTSPTRALDCFSRALALDPQHAEALWGYGTAAFFRSDYGPSREAFERLLAQESPDLHDAQRAEAHHFLGTIHVFEGTPALAIPHLEQARSLHPTFAESAYQLGVAHEALDALPLAVDALRDAATIDPWHLPSHYRLSKILRRLGHEEDAERRATIHRLVNELTDNTTAKVAQDGERRLALLTELVTVQPENHPARLEYAQRMLAISPSEATLALDALVEEGTSLATAYFLRAEQSLRWNDVADARRVMARFVECVPGVPRDRVPEPLRPYLPDA